MQNSNTVHVKSHTRDGHKVSSYTRSAPGAGVSLKEALSSASSVDLGDVLSVKKALMALGYYEPDSKIGLDEFTDNELFEGIRKFQEDNSLSVDGRMKPGGETETKINERLNKLTDRENIALNPSWGDKTAKELDKYMESYSKPQGKTRTGIKAAYNDMKRDFEEMKRLGLDGGDKFFHCKANYEAAKRGGLGKATGIAVSFGKELFDVSRYGLQASLDDWEANQKGWAGAKEGKTLLESCPRDPKKYLK